MSTLDELWADGPPIQSEDEILALVDAFFPPHAGGHAPFGRGHDCAELMVEHPLALSTDFFWEGSHFRRAYFSPADVGAKALAVTVSDLSAAGAEYLGFSLGLMLPGDMASGSLGRLLEGMAAFAGESGVILTGGDISRGNTLGMCITAWGKSVMPGRAGFLRRDPVQPEDVIFMAGKAGTGQGLRFGPGVARGGMALVGRLALEEHGPSAAKTYPETCRAHLRPEPAREEGLSLARLAAGGCRISLMDLSDGLLSDLPRLLKNRGAQLDFTSEAVHPEVAAFACEHGLVPEALFLEGGEEYALLGACAPGDWPVIKENLRHVVELGRVTPNRGATLRGAGFEMRGFDHFR